MKIYLVYADENCEAAAAFSSREKAVEALSGQDHHWFIQELDIDKEKLRTTWDITLDKVKKAIKTLDGPEYSFVPEGYVKQYYTPNHGMKLLKLL